MFKHGDRVMVLDSGDKECFKPATFIAYDYEALKGQIFVARKDESAFAIGYKFCRPLRPELKMDDPVWVRHSHTHSWLARHFCGWLKNGSIRVWNEGRTSHSSHNDKLYNSIYQLYTISDPYEEN